MRISLSLFPESWLLQTSRDRRLNSRIETLIGNVKLCSPPSNVGGRMTMSAKSSDRWAWRCTDTYLAKAFIYCAQLGNHIRRDRNLPVHLRPDGRACYSTPWKLKSSSWVVRTDAPATSGQHHHHHDSIRLTKQSLTRRNLGRYLTVFTQPAQSHSPFSSLESNRSQ